MPDGPLFTDDSPGSTAHEAATDAQNSFAKSPPGAVVVCRPGKGKKAKKGWTEADIKKAIDDCDGGTNVWANAKAANGGKDPIIKQGASAIGSGGDTDTTTGTITLDKKYDRCYTIDTLVHELTNLSHKADFDKSASDAAAGSLSRTDYIKTEEKIEYDGPKTALKAFDACKKKWGCKTSSFEWARKYKSFDDYYKALSREHKEYYGKFWDKTYKPAYDAKHPKAPVPPKKKH